MPLNNSTLFYQILGPFSNRDRVFNYSAGDTGGQGLIERYETWEPYNWTNYGDDGNVETTGIDLPSHHQYDPALREYYYYAMTGDETYLTRANALAVAYRDGYLVPNDYKIGNVYLYYVKGQALHYAATGDAASKDAVTGAAEWFAGNWPTATTGFIHRVVIWTGGTPNAGGTNLGHDIRTWANGWRAIIYAHALGCSSPGLSGWSPGGHDWEELANTYKARVLALQYPDGGFRSSESQKLLSGTTYADAVYDPAQLGLRPFYVGMLGDAFLEHLSIVGADSAINTALEACWEHLFTGASPAVWVTGGSADTYPAMRYIQWTGGFPDPGGVASALEVASADGAPLLNGFVLRVCAWLYQTTGDSIWKTRADQLIAGMQALEFSGRTKFINEGYCTGAFGAMPYLTGVDDNPGAEPAGGVTAPGSVVAITPSIVSGTATGAASAPGATVTVPLTITSGTAVGIVGAFNKTLRGIAKLTKRIAGTHQTSTTTLRGRAR